MRWQKPLALVLGFALLGLAGYVIVIHGGGAIPPTLENPEAYGSPMAIGLKLFQGYLLPFELTSVLLLVAMIGAVVLTGAAERRRRRPRPSRRS